MSKDEAPYDKFKKELGSMYNRWWAESDLDEKDLTNATAEVCDKLLGVSVEFEADFDLEDCEEEESE
jgi:hypothetical protein